MQAFDTAANCQAGTFEAGVQTQQLVCATGAASLFTQGTGITPPPCNVPTSDYPQHNGVCGANEVLTPAGDTTNGECFRPLSFTLAPAQSPSMPDPCAGVPANAFCPAAALVPGGPPPLLALSALAVLVAVGLLRGTRATRFSPV